MLVLIILESGQLILRIKHFLQNRTIDGFQLQHGLIKLMEQFIFMILTLEVGGQVLKYSKLGFKGNTILEPNYYLFHNNLSPLQYLNSINYSINVHSCFKVTYIYTVPSIFNLRC